MVTVGNIVVVWSRFIRLFDHHARDSRGQHFIRTGKRLRKLTGDGRYVSQSELNQKDMSFGSVARDALIKPLEINMKDPAILFTSVFLWSVLFVL
jgi:DHA1 family multidrug resistance protein-like MFS transporter